MKKIDIRELKFVCQCLVIPHKGQYWMDLLELFRGVDIFVPAVLEDLGDEDFWLESPLLKISLYDNVVRRCHFCFTSSCGSLEARNDIWDMKVSSGVSYSWMHRLLIEGTDSFRSNF